MTDSGNKSAGEIERLTRELGDARRQQQAAAGILKLISRSAFDLQTVLDTLTASAVSLCEADQGVILRREGDFYCLAANYFKFFNLKKPVS